VFKVNGTLFKSCTFPSENEALSTGKDVISLKSDGNNWYVCGKANHCASRQMKLVINVLADGAPSSAHSFVSSIIGVVLIATFNIATIF
jgi:hypothetical protein